jgi:hypothetical protein
MEGYTANFTLLTSILYIKSHVLDIFHRIIKSFIKSSPQRKIFRKIYDLTIGIFCHLFLNHPLLRNLKKSIEAWYEVGNLLGGYESMSNSFARP